MKKIKLTLGERILSLNFMQNGKPGNVEHIRKVDRVCKVLEKDLPKPGKDNQNEEFNLEFEDSDYDFFKKQFNIFDNWLPQAHRQILALDKKIN